MNDARLEQELDMLWREYKERQSKKGTKFSEVTKGRDKRTALGAGELGEDDAEDAADADGAVEDEGVPKARRVAAEAAAEEDRPTNPLLLDLGGKVAKPSAASAARDWFANDMFASSSLAVGSVKQAKSEAKAAAKRKLAEEEEDQDADDESDGEGFDDDEDEEDEEDEMEMEEAAQQPPPKSKKAKSAPTTAAVPGAFGKSGGGKKGLINPGKIGGAEAGSDDEDFDELRTASVVKKTKDKAREVKAAAKEEAKAAAAAKKLTGKDGKGGKGGKAGAHTRPLFSST